MNRSLMVSRIGLPDRGSLQLTDGALRMGTWLLADREHPAIARRLVDHGGRDNRHPDPQRIERRSDAGGMDRLDVRNSRGQRHERVGLEVHGIADVSDGGVGLERQRELREIYRFYASWRQRAAARRECPVGCSRRCCRSARCSVDWWARSRASGRTRPPRARLPCSGWARCSPERRTHPGGRRSRRSPRRGNPRGRAVDLDTGSIERLRLRRCRVRYAAVGASHSWSGDLPFDDAAGHPSSHSHVRGTARTERRLTWRTRSVMRTVST
jgi:hypothetical protein